MMSNILILILSTRNNNYHPFIESIRSTWLQDFKNQGIKCYFYEGAHEFERIHGDTIELTCGDLLTDTSIKLKRALLLLASKNFNPTLIYRTNLSSYIDVENFIRFLDEISDINNVYTGVAGKTYLYNEYLYKYKYLYWLFRKLPMGEKIVFASGSGFFLDWHNALAMAKSKKFNNLIDDVMVARSVEIQPDTLNAPIRFDIKSDGSHKISISEYNKLQSEKKLFHYRFKTDNRNLDAALIKKFHDLDFRNKYCTYI